MSLRVAILAHSTNPRGGVVHALELADALVGLGHDATVHAPDPKGAGFFRNADCRTVSIPASPAPADLTEMVETRIAEYVRYFEGPANRKFDVFHAQDSISGNALAVLKTRGLVGGAARTVHHVDAFKSAELAALQIRAINGADTHFVVSRTWRDWLAERFGIEAIVIGNGVNTRRFTNATDDRDGELRKRLGVERGPMFLSVGGVEERKNTIRILEAFQQVHRLHPSARLVIAGGASLLDHEAYQHLFAEALSASGLPDHAVIQTGPLAQADMPSLYRIADVFVFPSLKEGFGLAVIEAMASGLPVVTSRIAPFTEYLGENDVAWCDPLSAASIAGAMAAALGGLLGARLVAAGIVVAQRHDWRSTASAHLAAYENLKELHHA
jgi:glycosyltransferase-like protein